MQYLVRYGLVTADNPYKPHPVVLKKGEAGAPDHLNVVFYGSVIRVDGEFRMWYCGTGNDNGRIAQRLCYAVSRDGITWEKPELGLTEFNGDKKNNLASFDSQHRNNIHSILVLHDPEDPDPERRFKFINEVNPYITIAAYSADGLTWKESPNNPILKHNAIEPGGLMKFNGWYYLNGQGGNVGTKRALVTYLSRDFDHWTDAVALGFRRDIAPFTQIPGPHAGEQIHMGASLWNRGNVILGVYGQWHGETNDRHYLTMDLGLVVSSDGLQFVEPEPSFKLISAAEVLMDNSFPIGTVPAPCLQQGQGFENTEEETLIWYAPWRGTYVCVARWPRDRLGYFEVVRDPRPKLLMPEDTHTLFWREHIGDVVPPKTDPHFISCPIRLGGRGATVSVNADGLSDLARLRVSVLDDCFEPLPEYSGEQCVALNQSGLRQPVAWRQKQVIEPREQSVRLKVSWEGERLEEAFVYALYVEQSG